MARARCSWCSIIGKDAELRRRLVIRLSLSPLLKSLIFPRAQSMEAERLNAVTNKLADLDQRTDELRRYL